MSSLPTISRFTSTERLYPRKVMMLKKDCGNPGVHSLLDHITMSTDGKKISVAKAILVGQVCVNGGIFLLIGAAVLVCRAFELLSLPMALALGAAVAWPWWSLSVPRWRRWALARGANPGQLQKAGVRTGLLWPKGWIFEKTEIPPRK